LASSFSELDELPTNGEEDDDDDDDDLDDDDDVENPVGQVSILYNISYPLSAKSIFVTNVVAPRKNFRGTNFAEALVTQKGKVLLLWVNVEKLFFSIKAK
jgi:hypothetical protein